MIRLNEMTDEELALSYVRGNNQAFDLLLSRNQSKLFSYILFVVHEQDLANDIFQETFVKVITKLQEGRYIDSGKFSAWIMRIAHNVIMDWYRDNRAKNIVETSDDNDLSNDRLQHRGQICQRTGAARCEEDDEPAASDTEGNCLYALLSGDVVQGNRRDYRCEHQHCPGTNEIRHTQHEKNGEKEQAVT